jgi:RimJ/RimL family protein N-acetyltransferase
MAPRPPERIEIDDAAIVRHRPHHAEALAAAIGASLDHLRPWMPWAGEEAASAAFQRRRLTEEDPRWDADEDYVMLVVDPADQEVLGGTGLHRRRGPGTLEIGYWLRPDQTGRGLMTRAAAALTTVGLAVDGVDEVLIHCDVANTASGAIPRRLGYELRAVIDCERAAPAETGRQEVWVTTAVGSAVSATRD